LEVPMKPNRILLLQLALFMGWLAGQNVGIGTSTPTERLHVAGNLRLDNAFMPGNNAGMSGQILRSAGAGVPPYWASVGGIIAGHYAYNSTANVCVNTTTWTTHPGVSTTLSLQAGDIVYA